MAQITNQTPQALRIELEELKARPIRLTLSEIDANLNHLTLESFETFGQIDQLIHIATLYEQTRQLYFNCLAIPTDREKYLAQRAISLCPEPRVSTEFIQQLHTEAEQFYQQIETEHHNLFDRLRFLGFRPPS